MKKIKILIAFFAISFLTTSVFAQGGGTPRPRMEESDGSPSLRPTTVYVSNGSLTDNGDGTATLSTSAGSSPPGADRMISYNNSGSWGANDGFVIDYTNDVLALSRDGSRAGIDGSVMLAIINNNDATDNTNILISSREKAGIWFGDATSDDVGRIDYVWSDGTMHFTVQRSSQNEGHMEIGSSGLTIGGKIDGGDLAGVDYTLTFDGEDNDGVVTWMEDEDYFQFDDDVMISSTEEINFRDTDISMNSTDTDGILDISADGSVRLFYDNADVGAAVDGQSFYVYRREAEGDSYMRMYVEDDKGSYLLNSGGYFALQSADDFVIEAAAASDMYLDCGGSFYFRDQDAANNVVFQVDSATGNITYGAGGDADYTITCNANTNNGVITWMEDEDHWKFNDDVFLAGTLSADNIIYCKALSLDSNQYSIDTDGAGNMTFVDPTTGTKTLAQLATGGGSTAYDDITDPDANSSIDFTTFSNEWVSTTNNNFDILFRAAGTTTDLNQTLSSDTGQVFLKLDAASNAYNIIDRGAINRFGVIAYRTAGDDSFYAGLNNDSTTQYHIRYADDIPSGDVIVFTQHAATYELTASSGTQAFLKLAPEMLQTGTAGYTGLLLDVTESSTGSGTKNLLDLQVGSTSKFSVDNSGNVIAVGNVEVESLSSDTTITFREEYDNGNSGVADTVDWNNGNKQKSTLTGACTYTFTQPADGVGNFLLRLIQDGTGGRTATWPATVKWPGGTAPTLSTGATSQDIVTFYWNGAYYYGTASLDFK